MIKMGCLLFGLCVVLCFVPDLAPMLAQSETLLVKKSVISPTRQVQLYPEQMVLLFGLKSQLRVVRDGPIGTYCENCASGFVTHYGKPAVV
ncbi:MAG: hypothetical protein LWX55_15990 [Deltaproteobacteria bacterium]|jgi:hypothetical protein|nr:hypothetical protein [Deltaproteobacteria bacterium]